MFERSLESAEPGHSQGGSLVEKRLERVLVALLATADAELGQRQAASVRSTIASASTDGGSIP